MEILHLVVAAGLCAAPAKTAVLVSDQTSVPAPVVERVADQVAGLLTAGGVEVMDRAAASAKATAATGNKPSECGGQSACLGLVANSLDLLGVVGVFVSEALDERTAFVSLVRRGEIRATLKRDVLLQRDQPIRKTDLGDFVEAARAVLTPAELLTVKAPEKDRTVQFIVGGTGLGATVAGVVVGITGVVAKSNFDNIVAQPSLHTVDEAIAARGPANTLPPVGLVLAIGGVVTTVLAATLF